MSTRNISNIIDECAAQYRRENFKVTFSDSMLRPNELYLAIKFDVADWIPIHLTREEAIEVVRVMREKLGI